MNALVRKEIRLVLPAWIAAMVLAVFPVWLLWPGQHGLILPSPGMAVYAPFGIGVLLLGLTPFGQELNCGTFSILLAQPVSRRELWLAKIRVLAVALGLVFLAALASTHFRAEMVIEELKATDWHKLWNSPVTELQMRGVVRDIRFNVLWDALVIGGLSALAAFAGGLWTNLLFRNTSAAFWFSMLVPLGLGLLADKLFGGWIGGAALIPVLGGYAAAGFFWAKRFFLRVEDTQWTGGILSLPGLFQSTAGSSARNRRPLLALIRKEFQLHQVNLLIAVLLLVTHLVVIIVRRAGMEYFLQHRSAAMVWESWPMLWLVMPLLIGGVAVAEERKLGTLESFLSLPATRRREFVVKLSVALLLGIFLGGVMPLAVEGLGTLTGLPRNVFDVAMTFNWKLVSLAAGLLGGSAGLGLMAFYASTLTRNLLQALGLALVLSLFGAFLMAIAGAIASGQFFRESESSVPYRGPLIGWIGWPVMIGTVLALALGNFKLLNVGARIWWRNLLAIFAALTGTLILTSVTYHRVWEIWMPDEPVHRFGTAAIVSNVTDSSGGTPILGLTKMAASRSRLAVVLPDGKLWLKQRPLESGQREFNGHRFDWSRPTGPWSQGFVGGSNWRELAVSEAGCFALQADGSLWDLSGVRPRKSGATEPRRFDAGRDWKKIAGAAGHFTALKSDGTLWEWGLVSEWDGTNVSTRKISAPAQIGNDSDWLAICDSQETTVAIKSDGSVWRFRNVRELGTNRSWTVHNNFARPQRWLSLPRHQPVSLALDQNGDALAAVCADGTLWFGGAAIPVFGTSTPDSARLARHEMICMNNGSDWKEVHFFGWYKLAAVTGHGELWTWTWRYTARAGEFFLPQMPSRYSDWLSTCAGENDELLALTSGGLICRWGGPQSVFVPEYFYYDPHAWLAPSRIKAKKIAQLLP